MLQNGKFFLLLFYILIISSYIACNLSDNVIELNNGYQLAFEGKEGYFLNGKHEIPPSIVSYAYNDSFILIEQQANREAYTIALSSELMTRYIIYRNYVMDSSTAEGDFELISDLPIPDSAVFKILSQRNISTNNTREDIISCQSIADSILDYNEFYQRIFANKINYWIISHQKNQIYGPFAKNEYAKKVRIFCVSHKLKLTSLK